MLDDGLGRPGVGLMLIHGLMMPLAERVSLYALTGIFLLKYIDETKESKKGGSPLNAATFSALAEQNRLHIVELLIEQPLTVGEIAARLHIRQPQASKHLKVLSEAGLIEVQAVANRRICTLRPEPFQDLDDWLTTYRTLWEGRFDRLDGYLQQLQKDRGAPSPPETTPDSPSDDQ